MAHPSIPGDDRETRWRPTGCGNEVERRFADLEHIADALEDAHALAVASGEAYVAEPIKLALGRVSHALEMAGRRGGDAQ